MLRCTLLQVLTCTRTHRGSRTWPSGETGDGTVIIKKYANRRLYNTASSSYITLDDLAQMTREGTDFKVLDAKTGADITHRS